MANHNITHKYLLSILDYNPDTGIFIWRERPLKHFKNQRAWNTWNARFAGKQAGCLTEGYIQIVINYKKIRAHIVAHFYVYKKWPKNEIDHFDRNKSNNAINNLREATSSQNHQNVDRKIKSETGYKGVQVRGKKFRARINLNNKNIHLGYFNTPEEAHAAYKRAAQELHGDFACFG